MLNVALIEFLSGFFCSICSLVKDMSIVNARIEPIFQLKVENFNIICRFNYRLHCDLE